MTAVEARNKDKVEVLLQPMNQSDINVQDEVRILSDIGGQLQDVTYCLQILGWCALHFAAEKGDIEIAKQLLDQTLNPDTQLKDKVSLVKHNLYAYIIKA